MVMCVHGGGTVENGHTIRGSKEMEKAKPDNLSDALEIEITIPLGLRQQRSSD